MLRAILAALLTLGVGCGNTPLQPLSQQDTQVDVESIDAGVAATITASPTIVVRAQPMNYSTFLSLARSISIGTTKQLVAESLGMPHSGPLTGSESFLLYILRDLEGFPGFPPPVGTTVFGSVQFDLSDGLVSNVQWGWVDSIGPRPRKLGR